ncbi:MAG: DUF87 domain-containing protein, partial [Chloroflexota bacterium]|nr:DUF87 domain-containing protein [Chloroflexota bacterium]
MTELPAPHHGAGEARCLGRVVGGSLSRGLEVRIDDGVSVEEVRVGTNVVITGEKLRFFGLVTDVTLASANPQLAQAPPSANPFVARVLSGTSLYGQLRVLPQLVLPSDATTLLEGPQRVKTVPSHGATVRMASAQDMELVFGQEDERHFTIGTPLDMETKVCLDLEELVKRSNGIFGKTGTGKTFLTRILLSGILQKGVAANLVFDMHSEYGWQASDPERKRIVKGLKQLFPSRVAVFSLDEKSSQRRGVSPDGLVEIGYEEIEPEDMALLRQTLNLTDLAVDAVYSLERRFQRGWLEKLLSLGEGDEAKTTLSGLNISDMTYRNLRRGVEKLRRLPFIAPHPRGKAVEEILGNLQRGISVVLEFGSYDDLTAYILVANVLTRRIYERYRERTEQAQAEGKALPKPLVITIEEAHRFLNPEV